MFICEPCVIEAGMGMDEILLAIRSRGACEWKGKNCIGTGLTYDIHHSRIPPGPRDLRQTRQPIDLPSGRIFPISPLVWIDLETTGLDPNRSMVLEIGLRATTGDLMPVEGVEPFQLILIPTNGLDITKLDPAVVEMHSASGLFAEISAGKGYDAAQAERYMKEWLYLLRNVVYNSIPEDEKAELTYGDVKFLMAGSTVGQFDRQFFKRMFPDLDREFFEYRVLDVSSFKELVKRVYGVDAAKKSEDKAHRVLPDIQASIDELTFYIQNYLVPDLSLPPDLA